MTSPFGKSRSRTAKEEQPDKLRKTVRFEQEAPSTSSSSTVHVSLEYPESGRKKARFVHYSGHVEDDIQFSALDVFYQVDGRESRQIKEVSDWFREEDAGDLRRNELNEYNVFEGKLGKSEKKVGKV